MAIGPWLVCLLGVALAPVGSASAQTDLDVRVEDGLVTVNARSAPLREVLDRLAEAGGFTVRMSERLPGREVTVVFERLTMRRALGRVLAGVGHAVVGVPGGAPDSVRTVFVLAQGEPAPRPAPRALARAPAGLSAEQSLEAIRERLGAAELPENVRAALEAQLGALDTASGGAADARRAQKLEQALERLRDAPGLDAEVVEAIRQQLQDANVQ